MSPLMASRGNSGIVIHAVPTSHWYRNHCYRHSVAGACSLLHAACYIRIVSLHLGKPFLAQCSHVFHFISTLALHLFQTACGVCVPLRLWAIDRALYQETAFSIVLSEKFNDSFERSAIVGTTGTMTPFPKPTQPSWSPVLVFLHRV